MKTTILLGALFIMMFNEGNAQCTAVSKGTTQPQSQTVSSGNTATLSVSVNGTAPFSYFWYKNGSLVASTTNTSSTSNLYTTPTLSYPGDNGDTYYCLTTNCSSNNEVQSNTATITVTSSCTAVSKGSTQPQSQTKSAGMVATFTVSVAGTAPFSYFWYKNGSLVSSTTNSSSTINVYGTPTLSYPNDNGSTYYCLTTNCSSSYEVQSNTATLTVTSSCTGVSNGSTQPQSQTAISGSTATFNVSVNGTAPFSYFWYKNGSFASSTTDTSSTSNSYTTPTLSYPSDNGNTYYCLITNCSSNNEVQSNTATLTVTPPVSPSITSISPNPVTGSLSLQTITIYGTNFVNQPSLTLTWTGESGYLVPSSKVTFISGTELQMSIVTQTNSDVWSVTATNPGGLSSNKYIFDVDSPTACTAATMASQPLSKTVATSSTASFSISVNGTPPFSYFWYKNGVFLTNTTNTPSSSNTYTTPTLSAGDNGNTYYCLVTNCGSTKEVQSNTATLTVNTNQQTPTIQSIGASAHNNLTPGTPVSFSATASNNPTSWFWTFSGGTPSSYQTSSLQNPTIYFNNSGGYTVTLTVSNSVGSSTWSSATNYVTVNSTVTYQPVPLNTYPTPQNNYCPYTQEPINLATGAYEYQHRDLKMNAVNGAAEFQRYYNSLNGSVNSSVGYCWSHSFNFYVSDFSDTLWRIHYGDGHSADFIPLYNGGTPDSSFALYGGTYETLKRDTVSGNFTLKFKNQDIYLFNSSGTLVSITDRNGNTTFFTYSGGNLTQITLPGGRNWNLNYGGSYITSISDPLGRTVNYAYDVYGNLTTVTDANTHATQFSYDNNHQMTSVILPKGNTLVTNAYTSSRVTQQNDGLNNPTTIVYDTLNHFATVTYPDGATKVSYCDTLYRLIQETDELGFDKYYSYDANSNRTSFTDENGNTTSYSYDGVGNLDTIHQPFGVITSSTYSSLNDILTQTDGLAHTITYTRDGNGNLLNIAYPNNTTKSFIVNGLGQNMKSMDGLGNVTSYIYNSSGDLISETQPNGTYTYTNDSVGRRLFVTDPKNNSTSYGYDKNDHQTSMTDALTQTSSSQYDANDNLMTTTDKKQQQTLYSYDLKDRQSGITDASGHIKSFGYDLRDNLNSVTDENAHTTLYLYDPKNRKITATNALNSVIQLKYDAVGNLLSTTDADGVAVINGYDSLNRKISTSNALSQTTYFTYDAANRMVQKKDPLGRTASYGYDEIGLLKQVTDEANKVTTYIYDANRNMTTIFDPNGHKQTIQYDTANRPYIFTDADNHVLTRTYDPANNIISIAMPNGTVKSISYDPIYRTIAVSYSTGENYSFGYDADDNVTSAVCPAGTELFRYDSLNRKKQMTDVFSNSISYAYDYVGNRKGVTYPGNNEVTYLYNNVNEMTSVTDWLSKQTVYNYDVTGRMLNMTYANGIKCDYGYDAAGRFNQLNQYTVSPLDTVYYASITLDANGNRIQESKAGTVSPNIVSQIYNYSYSPADLLMNNGASSFANDADGNRLNQTTGGSTTSYSFTANDLLHSIVSDGNNTLFDYDAFGNRISRNVNGTQTKFALDLSGTLSQVLQEQNAGGQAKENYIYGLGLIERIDSAGHVLYYHHDAEDNTIALSNDSTRVTDKYAYEPFGRVLVHTGSTVQPYGFLGKYGVQAESDSLYFIRARYYDAVAGRFLSKDIHEIAFNNPQSINRFVYGFDNPIANIDPSGLFGWESFGIYALQEAEGLGYLSIVALSIPEIGAASVIVGPAGVLSDAELINDASKSFQAGSVNFYKAFNSNNNWVEANKFNGVFDGIYKNKGISALTKIGDAIGLVDDISHLASNLTNISSFDPFNQEFYNNNPIINLYNVLAGSNVNTSADNKNSCSGK